MIYIKKEAYDVCKIRSIYSFTKRKVDNNINSNCVRNTGPVSFVKKANMNKTNIISSC